MTALLMPRLLHTSQFNRTTADGVSLRMPLVLLQLLPLEALSVVRRPQALVRDLQYCIAPLLDRVD